MGQASERSVRRRRMFYVPGFDPFPARRYRELYRSEGADQARISGYRLEIAGAGPHAWEVTAAIEGASVATRIDVLVWSDIVRASLAHGIAATYGQLLRTAWIFGTTGALWRLMGLRKGPVIAALFPVAVLLAQLGVALALIWAGWSWLGILAVAPALALAWLWLRLCRRMDRHVYAHYLMHDYAFAARWWGANGPALEHRMSEFRAQILAALAEPDVDEVLVVGHSSGAHLAVSVVADVLRSEAPEGPALSLLTLGQAIPMMSFLPRAERLRRDLRDLSRSDRITWIDVTAPGDGCSFALCDPVAVTGVAPPDKRWPIIVSAAFTRTMGATRRRALRWRFFRLHFQYLCAFEHPGIYDYFKISAGPRALGDRFAGRRPSRSRIERVASPHRSVEP